MSTVWLHGGWSLLLGIQATRALQILSAIPAEYVTGVLKMQAVPHDLCILQSILVPPTCIRPVTVTRNTKTEQDLTRSLVDIVKANIVVDKMQQRLAANSTTPLPTTTTYALPPTGSRPVRATRSKLTGGAAIPSAPSAPSVPSVPSVQRGEPDGRLSQPLVTPAPKPKPTDTAKLAESLTKLQQAVSAYIDRDVSSMRKRRSTGPQRQRQSLVDRFGGGKKGRLRSNMMGRRVNNCARFVIGPDPLIDIWELRIPRSVAIETTREEIVGAHNFEAMCQCIRIGTSGLGGAQYVILNDGTRANLKNLTAAATEHVLQRLEYGCTVHRMLEAYDIGVFNRQPSLSKYSVMGHDLLPDHKGGRNSGRFPGNTCHPYNADFDGLCAARGDGLYACILLDRQLRSILY